MLYSSEDLAKLWDVVDDAHKANLILVSFIHKFGYTSDLVSNQEFIELNKMTTLLFELKNKIERTEVEP